MVAGFGTPDISALEGSSVRSSKGRTCVTCKIFSHGSSFFFLLVMKWPHLRCVCSNSSSVLYPCSIYLSLRATLDASKNPYYTFQIFCNQLLKQKYSKYTNYIPAVSAQNRTHYFAPTLPITTTGLTRT